MDSPVDSLCRRGPTGLVPSSFEGLITFIGVSGISRKSKLLQRLIGIRRAPLGCPAQIASSTNRQTIALDNQGVAVRSAAARRKFQGRNSLYERIPFETDLRGLDR